MEIVKPQVSDIVLSLKGRDAGKVFFVIGIEGEYVSLADGKGRRSEKPKRKKIKHTRLLVSDELKGPARVKEKLRNGEKVTNAELRKAIAEYAGSAEEGGMQVG